MSFTIPRGNLLKLDGLFTLNDFKQNVFALSHLFTVCFAMLARMLNTD